jgi:ubiquinone/menaquinone biosynthesis C-methylase UbiE
MPHPINPAHLGHLDNPLRRLIMPPGRSLDRFGVEEGDIVLDFGAGSGYFSFPAADRVGERGFVYALDIAPEAIAIIEGKIAATGRKNIRPIRTSGGDWGLAREVGTIALMITVLHEVGDKAAVLERLYDCLRPGGRIAILEFKGRAFFGPPKDERIDEASMRGLLEEAGFADARFTPWSPLFYLATARK